MKMRTVLAEAVAPGGGAVQLVEEGGHYVVYLNGIVLMSNGIHGSEETMADVACARLSGRDDVRVAIGGLGMGFTLRATLDAVGPHAEVTVVEFLPALVEWNRDLLAPLAGHPLDDPRVTLELVDFVEWVKGRPKPFDAILVDIDNGPEAFTAQANEWLYSQAGLRAMREALRPGGMLVVWSAFEAPSFEKRLRHANLDVEVVALRARAKQRKGPRHTLYIGRRPG